MMSTGSRSRSLPAEIYLEIFSHLDAHDDKNLLLSLRLCSRQICQLVTPQAFEILKLNVSLEDTLKKAVYLSKNPTAGKYIRGIHIGTKSAIPISPELAVLKQEYSMLHTISSYRMTCLFILLWNIFEVLETPLRMFTVQGTGPNIEGFSEAFWHDKTRWLMSASWVLNNALAFLWANQTQKCPEGFTLDHETMDLFASHNYEFFAFGDGAVVLLDCWLRDQTASLAFRGDPLGLMEWEEEYHLASDRIREPSHEYLSNLFRILGVEMTPAIITPFCHSDIPTAHNTPQDYWIDEDRKIFIFRALKPSTLHMRNVHYDCLSIPRIIPVFRAQDRLTSLRLENFSIKPVNLRRAQPSEFFWQILKAIRETAKNLTDLYLRMLHYKHFRARKFTDSFQGRQDRAIYTPHIEDVEELHLLLDDIAARRTLRGLLPDPWLVTAKDDYLHDYGDYWSA